MIVPEVGNVMKFKAAIEAAALDDLAIIPTKILRVFRERAEWHSREN